jgi:hypothetical protein
VVAGGLLKTIDAAFLNIGDIFAILHALLAFGKSNWKTNLSSLHRE